MALLKVVLLGSFEAGRNSLLYRFQEKKTHTPFEFEEVRVTVCDEEYVLNLYNATSWDDIVIKRKIYQNADVFLVLFSVVDPVSYSSVTKHWIQAMIDNLPSAPTMLVGCEKCQRSYNPKPFQKLKTLPRRSITSEMGERLAQKINAVKYMECSNFDGLRLEDIYEEVAWTSLRYTGKQHRKTMNWFRIIVAGNCQSGEKDVIRRFVYDERLNVFGEDLSEELSFSDIKDDHFSTFIEIDGEKYGMEIEYIPAYEINDKRSKMADFIVLIFSIVKPESYGEISKELILNIEKYKTLSQIPSNILVGNHIELRNHPEI